VLLRLMHTSGGQDRLGTGLAALHYFAFDKSGRAILQLMLLDGAFLLASGLLIYLAGISGRHLWVFFACLFVLIVPGMIGGATYGPEGMRHFGITWPVRFAAIWGLLVASCLCSIAYSQTPFIFRRTVRASVILVVVLVSFGAQIYALRIRKEYDFVSRFVW